MNAKTALCELPAYRKSSTEAGVSQPRLTTTLQSLSAVLFLLIVKGTLSASNTPPSLSNIANQTIHENTSTGPIGFTAVDAETVADNLTLTADSSNLTLVTISNVAFGGSGTNRTV